MLTVLARHYGRSVLEVAPTSAQLLITYLGQQLLPQVNPFLTHHKAELKERERDRKLREQQDRAYQDSPRRDRERIEVRIRAEREEAECVRRDEDACEKKNAYNRNGKDKKV